MKEINLDAILKSYLTIEAMRLNNPGYTYNMVIAAMKHACCEVLDLAAENAEAKYFNIETGKYVTVEDYNEEECYFSHISKESILQIKDWIK